MTAETYLLFLNEDGDFAKVMDNLCGRTYSDTVLRGWCQTLIAMTYAKEEKDWVFAKRTMEPVCAAFPYARGITTELLTYVCALARNHAPLALVCEAYFRDTGCDRVLVSRDKLIETFAPICVALPRAAAKVGLSPDEYKYVTWADELTRDKLARFGIGVCATIDQYYRPYAYVDPAPVPTADALPVETAPQAQASASESNASGPRPWSHATFQLLTRNDEPFAYDADAMRADLESLRSPGVPNASILLALRKFRIEMFRTLYTAELPIDWKQSEKDLCVLGLVEHALAALYSLHRVGK